MLRWHAEEECACIGQNLGVNYCVGRGSLESEVEQSGEGIRKAEITWRTRTETHRLS